MKDETLEEKPSFIFRLMKNEGSDKLQLSSFIRQIEKMRKKASKMRAEKTHDFWESPGRDFLSPGSPKMNTNQQDNLQKNNKKKTTYSK